MPRPTNSLLTQAQTARNDLRALQLAAVANGSKELAGVAQRALNEFNHPAFTGEENTRGITIVPR